MVEIGYDPRGEQGIEGRRYFSKGGSNRTHHVHVYQNGT
ncbi:GrpB family protein [Bacillus sp. ISL-40]|nr:GrpB family protein [Bacillus sp. ISL-40]MBT2724755.1 GrpB family protein [Bacillus sp. ISL-46]MBT2744586.1 GrpB family protein [Bacillus sp. ISL-77]